MTTSDTTIKEIETLLQKLTPEEALTIPAINQYIQNSLNYATEYTINAITGPAKESIDADSWKIQIAYRGKNSYAILHRGRCYHKKGTWDHEPLNSSRTNTFLKTHRFPLTEALNKAKKLSETITINGLTAKQFEIWYQEKFSDQKQN